MGLYNKRAHGFLPKGPIRRDKVNEAIAPFWMKRFPSSELADSSRDSAVFDTTDDIELGCISNDIAQKLSDIDSLFAKNAHLTDMRCLHAVHFWYDKSHFLEPTIA